ncbi:hypothetical protein ACHHYP_16398, partial [Achlya hypogyna]
MGQEDVPTPTAARVQSTPALPKPPSYSGSTATEKRVFMPDLRMDFKELDAVSRMSKLVADMYTLLEDNNLLWTLEAEPKRINKRLVGALAPSGFKHIFVNDLAMEGNKPLWKDVTKMVVYLRSRAEAWIQWEPRRALDAAMADTGADNCVVSRGLLDEPMTLCVQPRLQRPAKPHVLQPFGSKSPPIKVSWTAQFGEVLLQTSAGPLALRGLVALVNEEDKTSYMLLSRPVLVKLGFSLDELLVKALEKQAVYQVSDVWPTDQETKLSSLIALASDIDDDPASIELVATPELGDHDAAAVRQALDERDATGNVGSKPQHVNNLVTAVEQSSPDFISPLQQPDFDFPTRDAIVAAQKQAIGEGEDHAAQHATWCEALTNMHRKCTSKVLRQRLRGREFRVSPSRAETPNFSIGDFFLVAEPEVTHKLQYRWQGPRVITGSKNPWVFEVQLLVPPCETKDTHVQRMQFYCEHDHGMLEDITAQATFAAGGHNVRGFGAIRNTPRVGWEIEVKWLGLQDLDNTWEPALELYQDVPDLLLRHLLREVRNGEPQYPELLAFLKNRLEMRGQKILQVFEE